MDKKFLWGSATAAYQCEGAWNVDEKGLSIWDDFSHDEKRNTSQITGDEASNYFYQFEEDFDLLKAGGQNSYRFSIAWTRIMPNGTGSINKKGIAFYNKIIDSLISKGIKPFVTLYHYDLPLVLQQQGGWENRQTAAAFAEFAKVCYAAFGDRVKLWTTLNEPYYSLSSMYLAGNYPPHLRDPKKFIPAAYHSMLASALAVAEFRNFTNIGEIGIVADYTPCYGINSSLECQKAVKFAAAFFNDWVLDSAIKGYFPPMIQELLVKKMDLSFLKKNDEQIFKAGVVDFIGINYYSRALIQPYTIGPSFIKKNNSGQRDAANSHLQMVIAPLFEVVEDKESDHTQWDMEIFPKGMYDSLLTLSKKYDHIPIYITENGVGLYEQLSENNIVEDKERISFLQVHIEEMLKAMEAGCNVRGYYVWSTMDLYSWINGYQKRYGLVYIDYENNFRRIPKKSYYWYQQFIEKWACKNENG